MRVGELIRKLWNLDQDALVIVSRDEEGNRFSVLYQVDPNMKYSERDMEAYDLGESEEDVGECVKCVVLWP